MPESSSRSDPLSAGDRLFLIDGSAFAYRAHFAMARSNLSNARGLPTGAIFGFASDLWRLAKKVAPSHAAVVFDPPDKTFRHELFADYKATRQKMPDELVVQLPHIHRAAASLGFNVVMVSGFEADDVIGTLACHAAATGLPVSIVTGDKDFMQLVNDRIQLYNSLRQGEEPAIIGPREVEEKFGVAPPQVVDILALMGDSSDNIPGVPGIGMKGAQRLIQRFGSLEALLEAPPEALSPKDYGALQEHRGTGLLSKRLATIHTDVPGVPEIEELAYAGPDRPAAAVLFRELGFRTLAEEMSAAPEEARDFSGYEIVRTEEALEALIERLRAADLIAVDTETTGLASRHARLIGVSVAVEPGRAAYVPLNLVPPILPDPPDAAFRGQAVLERLRPVLEDASLRKCGQNVKYDLVVLRCHGVRLRGVVLDTMIASYLLEPHEREKGLDALALRHFGYVKIKTEELIGRGKSQITMDLVPVDDVGCYACEDADFTLRLARLFLPRLEESGLQQLLEEVEIPLIEVLAEMECSGVRVDRDRLVAMARELENQAFDLEQRVYAAAGATFNINSPQQLGKVLFEDLHVHQACSYRPKRTKTGWATGQEVLEALASHPLPALILEYRSLTKLLGTYIRPLPDLVETGSGRIHASFNQAVAATGRLSSSDPNLQNIPIRSELGRKIREAFLAAGPDHALLSADYSQVELRILAHLSEDPGLIRAFQEDADIHRDTAARVFGVRPEEVDPTMRSRAKAINFGILYGMGPQRLARETGLDLEEAKAFIARYFEAFPAVREFLEGLKDFARKEGYAVTLLGRRRPIPDIVSSNRMLRAAAENMAMNTPIQGSAADILKLAMIRLYRRIIAEGLGARMILTVHDELVLDVPRPELEHVREITRREMETAVSLRVPLKVEVGCGESWLDCH